MKLISVNIGQQDTLNTPNGAVQTGIIKKPISTSSFGEAPLTIGDRLHIGDVIIEISAPRTPCFKLATRNGDPGFIKDFVQATRTGAYARVIKTGAITAGDNIVLTKTTEEYPSLYPPNRLATPKPRAYIFTLLNDHMEQGNEKKCIYYPSVAIGLRRR
jgi:MOSC domain-containing protein YiiM